MFACDHITVVPPEPSVIFHTAPITFLRGEMGADINNASFPNHTLKRPAAKGAVLRPRLKLPAPGLHPPQKPLYDIGNSGARKKRRQTIQRGF